MPVALLVAVIAMLAACAPRTFQRVRGKIAARIQLRDGLAWRGDTPPGTPVNTLQPGVWRVTATPAWDRERRVDNGRRTRVARRHKRPRDGYVAGHDRC